MVGLRVQHFKVDSAVPFVHVNLIVSTVLPALAFTHLVPLCPCSSMHCNVKEQICSVSNAQKHRLHNVSVRPVAATNRLLRCLLGNDVDAQNKLVLTCIGHT